MPAMEGTAMLTAPPRTGDGLRGSGASGEGRFAGTSVPGSSGVPREDPGSRPAATLALTVLTVVSAAGLGRVFSTDRWVWPVFGTIAVIQLLCWSLRRSRVGSLAAAPVVAAGIVLMVSWTVLGRYTFYGAPTAGTWDHSVSAIRDLGNQFASSVPPVTPTTAFELVAVGGAALAAALGDWAAFRWGSPLGALLPGLTAFIFCSTSAQGTGRGALVALEVAAVCTFLVVERATADGRTVWFAGVRSGVGPWVLATGGLVSAAAVLSAGLLSPALSARDGHGVLGWRSGFGGGSGERIVPNPLVDLRTRLIQYSNRPVFLVSSSVPSYWRLTSLDTFDGTNWTSTGSYGGFGSRLPGVPPGATVRTVRAAFRIQALDSVWLPAQFDPLSVQGVHKVTYDPQSNSLLASTATSDNLQYSVTSYQYLDTLSPEELRSAPPVAGDAVAQHNLSLPVSVDGAVLTLARSITGGQGTEYDRALAIQNYLRSPIFKYSLNPQTDGTGNQALYNFLFETRSGYCQQFAGAYAVLARAVGLPTRLAVGFATGDPAPGGGYQVHDRDSHTWPEIWFGPRFGWVPFEPTPGFGVPGTGRYTHTSGSSTGLAPSTTPTVPTTVAGSSQTTPQIEKPHTKSAPTTVAAIAAPHRSSGLGSWWLIPPAVVAAWLLGNGAGPVVVRRLRRRRAARHGSRAVVLGAWQEVASGLLWFGIRRRTDETDHEFAGRATAALRRSDIDTTWSYGGIEGLARMAGQAGFAASVPDDLGEQARVAATEIERRLTASTSRRRRMARLWAPPPGTWSGLVRRLTPGGGGRSGAPGSGVSGSTAGSAAAG